MYYNLFILLQNGDVLLKHDKAYSILVVVLIIFVGMIFFLIRTERKVGALEKKIQGIRLPDQTKWSNADDGDESEENKID